MAKFPIVHDVVGKFMVLPQDHVHAYIVELDQAVVVIDATLALDSANELRSRAEALGKPIEAVLLTHGHPDHYTGLAVFADIPKYASQGAVDFAHREDVAKADVAKTYLGDDYPDTRVFPDHIVADGDTLTFDGLTFTFTDLGPAESDSDGMWSFSKDGVMHAFVGDSVANRSHCFFRDGHTEEWLEVLDRLERELPESTKIYVGHGETPADKEIIDWQRQYILTFLDAVDGLEDKSIPVSRANQERIIAKVQEYLPGTATLFLLDYELDVSLPELLRQRRHVGA